MIIKSTSKLLFNSKLKYSIILLFSIVFFSCSTKKVSNLSAGNALESENMTIHSDTFKVDLNASVTTWIASRPSKKHNGIIPINSGKIIVAENEIIGGTVIIDITGIKIKDLESDNVSHDKLKGHLLSADFFLADSFPVSLFEIIQITPYDTLPEYDNKEEFEAEFKPATMSAFMLENPSHMVLGNLTMRGTTRSIRFPANISITPDQIIAEARFNINRADWGLMYQDESSVIDKLKDQFIYNTINVGFYLKAVK